MRQIKRLAALLLAAAITAATPLAALALPAGGYVPVKATQYRWDEKTSTWVQTSERTMSFKSDGRKTGNSSVSSSGTLTRNNVATILWKYAGSPRTVSPNNPFSDVKKSAAIAWGKSKHIFTGTKFYPQNNCLRGDFALFLYRYNKAH